MRGAAAEIAVHTALRKLGGSAVSVFYYRDKQKREIDFLVELGSGQHLPLEVKAGARVPAQTDQWLAQTVAELKAPLALALSNEQLSTDRPVLHVPLLMVCA